MSEPVRVTRDVDAAPDVVWARVADVAWKSVATVTDCVPGKVFAFHVKAVGMDVADRRYEFEANGAGCTVTEEWTDRRNGLMHFLSGKATGVDDRAAHNREGMLQTLDRLAAAAGSTQA